MTNRARLAVVVLAFAGIGLAAAALHAAESSFPLPAANERLLYLRSGKVADRLMLSFDALAADVYWIRAIQAYGRDLKRPNPVGRFELVSPLLDLTTTLDPQFLIAYRFGAVFLALEPPNGPGRPDLAIQLLQKGWAANPTRWQLAHDIGFVHYFHTGDFKAAGEWFARAAALKGAPGWLGPLAATTMASGGDRAGGRRMLEGLLESPDEYVRRAAARALKQLTALDAIDQLQALVEQFKTARGGYPAGWQDMVRAGLLRGIPLDEDKTPFVYDPSTRLVTLSPVSPLSPLPDTLKKR